MKKELIHKWTKRGTIPCGIHIFSFNFVKHSKWKWQEVTCKRCLRLRKKK